MKSLLWSNRFHVGGKFFFVGNREFKIDFIRTAIIGCGKMVVHVFVCRRNRLRKIPLKLFLDIIFCGRRDTIKFPVIRQIEALRHLPHTAASAGDAQKRDNAKHDGKQRKENEKAARDLLLCFASHTRPPLMLR